MKRTIYSFQPAGSVSAQPGKTSLPRQTVISVSKILNFYCSKSTLRAFFQKMYNYLRSFSQGPHQDLTTVKKTHKRPHTSEIKMLAMVV